MIRLSSQFSELVLTPALACLLPWSMSYRINRQLSRLDWIYRAETDLAEAAAAETGLFETGTIWRRHYRLNRLVDGVDPWLSRFRGERWLDRNMKVKGSWPQDGPFVAASMHWGTGLWALRHIRSHAGPVAMTLRPESEWATTFSTPMRAYLRSIESKIAMAGGAPILHTGSGVTGRVRESFERGHNLLVLVDVPKGGNRGGFPVDFLGRPTYFASGLLNIALQMKRPIVPYSIGLDFKTGERQLEIMPPIEAEDIQEVMSILAGYLDNLVRAQPPGWHFWHLLPNLLSPDFSARANQ